jgi:hypothetical protein
VFANNSVFGSGKGNDVYVCVESSYYDNAEHITDDCTHSPAPQFVVMNVCLLVCLFVCLVFFFVAVVNLFVYLFVYLFICLFVCFIILGFC